MQTDGFTVVARRKKGRADASLVAAPGHSVGGGTVDPALMQKLAAEISDMVLDLADSPVARAIKGGLVGRRIDRLVCYGLGRFGGGAECHIGEARRCQWQLALLLFLRQHFGADVGCTVCDPAFSMREWALAVHFKLEVLAANDGGRIPLVTQSDTQTALVYLPHCPLELCNNVLWAHWAPQLMPRLIVLGNSFEHYRDALTTHQLHARAEYVQRIAPLVTETPCSAVDADTPLETAFNNLALHTFSIAPGTTVPATLDTAPADSSAPAPDATECPAVHRCDGARVCEADFSWVKCAASELPLGAELLIIS